MKSYVCFDFVGSLCRTSVLVNIFASLEIRTLFSSSATHTSRLTQHCCVFFSIQIQHANHKSSCFRYFVSFISCERFLFCCCQWQKITQKFRLWCSVHWSKPNLCTRLQPNPLARSLKRSCKRFVKKKKTQSIQQHEQSFLSSSNYQTLPFDRMSI